MDSKEILQAIDIYRRQFERNCVCKMEFPHNEHIDLDYLERDKIAALRHCHRMLDDIEQFVKEGRIDKAYGWLCFIQGCLWMSGLRTLNELKNHNSLGPAL